MRQNTKRIYRGKNFMFLQSITVNLNSGTDGSILYVFCELLQRALGSMKGIGRAGNSY